MEELIRINKYISETGFCSRREADKLIADERVTVNGIRAEMGTKVALTDKVKIDGQIIRLPEKVNVEDEEVLLHKKKVKLNRSQRKSVDYSSRSSLRGTRGGIRNMKKRKAQDDKGDAPKNRLPENKKETKNKDFQKKGIEKKGSRVRK